MPEFTGTITEPGLYGDIPEDQYHADPVDGGSLSVTSSRLLMPPNCPAIFDHFRRHPKQSTKSMDLGTVVHGMILGSMAVGHVSRGGRGWRQSARRGRRDQRRQGPAAAQPARHPPVPATAPDARLTAPDSGTRAVFKDGTVAAPRRAPAP